MTFAKFKEREDGDLASIAFNNIFEPTFNDSFLSDPIPPIWDFGDLCELGEDLVSTL